MYNFPSFQEARRADRGKRVIVTGGSSGLGEAAVRVFTRHGALVAALDVEDAADEKVAAAATTSEQERDFVLDVKRRFDVILSKLS